MMKLAERAVRKALEFGATEAEAYLQRVRTVRVEFTENINNFKTIESLGIGLRAASGKKIATYSTSVLNETEIDKAAAKAVKIAKVAPEDPHWQHFNTKFGKAPAEGYYDKTIDNIEAQEIVERLKSAINRIEDSKKAHPTLSSLTMSVSNVFIANSYHQSEERKETGVQVSMNASAEEADLKSTGNMRQEARFWKQIKPEDLAVKAAEKALKFLRAKPISSCRTSVVFKNQIFAGIMEVMLSGPINADWVQKGMSPLAGKLNTKVFSEQINIVDNGLMFGGWQTKPFDDEGCQTRKTPIIEHGTLKHYIYDTYTALKDNVDSTGNAQRANYSMPPQPTPNNLVLDPGEANPEDIIDETKSGIYVEDTIGEWLSDPVSGNLNATITHGYLIENGRLAEPIKGVIFSGNFYELLKNGVELLGNDLRNSMQYYSPTIKFTQLAIAGNK